MKDSSIALTIESFFKNWYEIDKYFALSPPNHLIAKYVEYTWYFEKTMILSHDLNIFGFIFIILHNKY